MGLNLDVPGNRHAHRREQIEERSGSLYIPDCGEEHPLTRTLAAEIPLPLPLRRFIGMPSINPGHERLIHLAVHIGKGLLRHHMPVVVGPAPKLAVELPEQNFRCGGVVGFDQFPNIAQEAMNCRLGGRDQELTCVFTQIEPQKIKAIVDMRDMVLARVENQGENRVCAR